MKQVICKMCQEIVYYPEDHFDTEYCSACDQDLVLEKSIGINNKEKRNEENYGQNN